MELKREDIERKDRKDVGNAGNSEGGQLTSDEAKGFQFFPICTPIPNNPPKAPMY